MIYTVLSFLPLLGAAGVVLLAQTQVRERSERAALMLTVGGGMEAAYLLARRFLEGNMVLPLASPLVQVGAVGALAYGLMILVDELNPKVPAPMSAALTAAQQVDTSMVARVFYGGFGVLGILGTGSYNLPAAAISVLALVGVLAGSVWLERQGPLGRWILERRPESVVWSYVYQLRVVNRKTGSSTTHWSTQLGLSSGAKVGIPALGETAAQAMVMAVAERCPGIVLGFSPENVQRFASSPQTMRGPRI